jgi:hypothetical protein
MDAEFEAQLPTMQKRRDEDPYPNASPAYGHPLLSDQEDPELLAAMHEQQPYTNYRHLNKTVLIPLEMPPESSYENDFRTFALVPSQSVKNGQPQRLSIQPWAADLIATAFVRALATSVLPEWISWRSFAKKLEFCEQLRTCVLEHYLDPEGLAANQEGFVFCALVIRACLPYLVPRLRGDSYYISGREPVIIPNAVLKHLHGGSRECVGSLHARENF